METIIVENISPIYSKDGECIAVFVQTNQGSYIYNDKTEEVI